MSAITIPAMADLYAGRGLMADTTGREIYMAESVRWHLNHAMLFRWRLAVRGAAANSS